MQIRVLSIRQPWAWLVANGHKDIENRTWPTPFRGPFLIHASQRMSPDEYANALAAVEVIRPALAANFPPREQFQRGGYIGIAEMVDCVSTHRSPWFCGAAFADTFGFVIANARPLPFVPARGMLNFYTVTLSAAEQAALTL